jgi:hypothetical protein
MKVYILFIIGLLVATSNAETLDKWLFQQIVDDETTLLKALNKTDGHSIELLRDSKYYVPFFTEPPHNFSFSASGQKSSLDSFLKANLNEFLPGGYIYRISFDHAYPLYATSAGYWEPGSKKWYSPDLRKSFAIQPSQVWSDRSNDFLYATIIGPPPPRLLVYGYDGEIKHEEAFDLSAVDFEQRLDAALKRYSQNNKPVLEMISLSEYLENRDAPWRRLDISGQFNLRNQQQRPEEQERLRQSGQLSRTATIELLQSIQKVPPTPAPAVTPALITPAPAAMSSGSPSPTVSETKSSSGFPTIPVAIFVVVIVGIVIHLLRRKSK